MIAPFIEKLQAEVHSTFLRHKASLPAKPGRVKLIFLTLLHEVGGGKLKAFFLYTSESNNWRQTHEKQWGRPVI